MCKESSTNGFWANSAKVSAKLAVASGVSLIALSSAAIAEEAEVDITEITVSATKNPVEAFSVPASVSVVSKEEIDDLIASSISDIFLSVPGLTFDGGPRRNGETPALRGISGEGVVVLFDGVRQSFLSGHDGRFFIEPDLLKSAEVVRGSSSSLYGSGAVGGVITFNTVDAADLLKEGSNAGYRLSTGYQDVSNEWMTGATVFGRSDDGRVDGLVSLSLRGAGDISLGNETTLPAEDEIGSGLAKVTFKATDALTLSASWMGYRNNAVEPNNGQGNNTGDLMDKKVKSDTYRAGLSFNPETKFVDLNIVGFVNNASVEEEDLDTDREIARDVETVGISFDNRSRFEFSETSSLVLTYGGEYYKDEQVGVDNNTADGTRGGVPDATSKTTGLFVQAELTANTAIGEFIAIPGLRYDSFKNTAVGEAIETDESSTSPRFALTWQPTDGIMLYGSYSEAFRAPSYNEIFADDLHFEIPLGPFVTAPNFFIPNSDLRPERSKTWEFGAGYNSSDVFTEEDQLTFKGAYYTSDVSDLIDLEVNFEFSAPCFVPTIPGDCNAGTSRNINTGAADMDGFEFEAVYDHPAFRMMATYSTVNGTDAETGDYVGVLTPNRLFLSGEAKLDSMDARLGLRTTFAAKHDKVNDVTAERAAYEKVDVYMVWAPQDGALDGLRVDLGVDNLFDKTIETVFAGVVDPGRNFKGRISWTGSF